ncbi:Peroxiredoxin [Cohaesibacter sp. ES.047]|uniref:peroxiredoxin n=1 Tax=Cohaesibacter sp. ES.047 TaxID=1798205 RepID=UPI000BB7A04B|nr:peroxiredoxin [Cohaesibacter sp. ES.047]SNY92058.1 Peroxiredoxin [Cohaesibacter sp. ES.047]
MIKIGDKLPDATFMVMGKDGKIEKRLSDMTAGRKLVLFGVPGAFTPTCHHNHLPGYINSIDGLHALGVDEVAVVSVNDVYVMGAWAKASGGEGQVTFLADGNAEFVRACGLDMDMSAGGMGVRSSRFSMIVDDGVVTHLNLEDNPGVVEKSGATGIIEQLKGA